MEHLQSHLFRLKENKWAKDGPWYNKWFSCPAHFLMETTCDIIRVTRCTLWLGDDHVRQRARVQRIRIAVGTREDERSMDHTHLARDYYARRLLMEGATTAVLRLINYHCHSFTFAIRRVRVPNIVPYKASWFADHLCVNSPAITPLLQRHTSSVIKKEREKERERERVEDRVEERKKRGKDRIQMQVIAKSLNFLFDSSFK